MHRSGSRSQPYASADEAGAAGRTDSLQQFVPASDWGRAIDSSIWVPLRDQGFVEVHGGSAWRSWPDRIEVVSLHSLTAAEAAQLGTSTLSFSLGLGIHPIVSRTFPDIAQRGGRPRPVDTQCDLRFTLRKAIAQPELNKSEIWSIQRDGSNLLPVIHDAHDVMLTQGLAWFRRFASLRDILDFVVNKPETRVGTFGPGPLGSPQRRQLAGDLTRVLTG